MKTKPFDLKAALAGAKVVTRDGRKVDNVRYVGARGGYPLTADVKGAAHLKLFTETGRWVNNESTCEHDLFLVDEPPARHQPFNLEAALKGEPVVTRDGRPVSDLKRFETVDRIYGALNGSVLGWGLEGSLIPSGESRSDLFMVSPEPKMREVWLNMYSTFVGAHSTQIEADKAAFGGRIGNARRVLIPEEE